jgi:hypothetical protein
MKPLFLAFAALSLTLASTLVSPARADVAPPAGYTETCTVALREQPGTTCKTCASGNAMESACTVTFNMTKYTYVCQTWGGSTWTEVWCDGPPAEIVTGCAIAGPAAPWSVVATVGLLTAAAAIARRRRARRSAR